MEQFKIFMSGADGRFAVPRYGCHVKVASDRTPNLKQREKAMKNVFLAGMLAAGLFVGCTKPSNEHVSKETADQTQSKSGEVDSRIEGIDYNGKGDLVGTFARDPKTGKIRFYSAKKDR